MNYLSHSSKNGLTEMRDVTTLSNKERQVLSKIDLPDKLIADELSIAENTVRSHQKSIRQKLRLTSKIEMAVWAVKLGLI